MVNKTFFLGLLLTACVINRLPKDLDGRVYSTGNIGMPGEYKFIFSDDKTFYFQRPLIYSEGRYEWISRDSIRFASYRLGISDPKLLGGKIFNEISGKTAKVKKNKLNFDGFTYFLHVISSIYLVERWKSL